MHASIMSLKKIQRKKSVFTCIIVKGPQLYGIYNFNNVFYVSVVCQWTINKWVKSTFRKSVLNHTVMEVFPLSCHKELWYLSDAPPETASLTLCEPISRAQDWLMPNLGHEPVSMTRSNRRYTECTWWLREAAHSYMCAFSCMRYLIWQTLLFFRFSVVVFCGIEPHERSVI